MPAAVLAFSFVPLLADAGVGAPFLFHGLWRAGLAAGGLVFLAGFYPEPAFRLRSWSTLFRRSFRPSAFLCFIGSFQFLLFTLSLRAGVDASLAAVLLEAWPLLAIIVAGRLFRSEGRYGRSLLFPLLLAACLWLLSPLAGWQLFGADGFSFPGSLWGIGLAFSASLAGVLESSFNLRWGADAARTQTGSGDEIFFCVAGLTAVAALSAPVHLGLSLLAGEPGISFSRGLAGLLGGLAVQAAGSILYRIALLRTRRLETISLGYLIPFLSLLWLAVLPVP